MQRVFEELALNVHFLALLVALEGRQEDLELSILDVRVHDKVVVVFEALI